MAEQDSFRPALRRFRFIIGGIFIAFVLLVAGVCFLPHDPSSIIAALDQKAAKLRAEGVPMSWEDLVKPSPTPEQDANVVLRDALARVNIGRQSSVVPFVSNARMPQRNAAIPKDVMEAIAEALSGSEPVLHAIPSELRNVRFTTTWTQYFKNATPIPWEEFRALQQTCGLKALYESELGDATKAFDALRKGWGVASTPAGDSLVFAMIRVACAGLMCDATEQTLNRIRLHDSQLREIAELLPVEVVDDLGEAVTSERAMALYWLELFRQQQRSNYRFRLQRGAERLLGVFMELKSRYRDADYLLLLTSYEKIELAQTKPLLERVRLVTLIATNFTTNVQSTFPDIVMPNFAKAVSLASEVKARLVALQAALAIERFRLAHNTLPPTLDALVPQYCSTRPRDAFDEQPLRYAKRDRGYVVYSIGADGVDNGGVERDARRKSGYDLTITVER